GHPCMQALQPIHRSGSKSTIPSSRSQRAVTGQTSVQGESSQWLHRITEKFRFVFGNSPFSTYLTQVLFTPIGSSCSVLHATVQA
ncbi:MAG: hypothetical protein ACI9YT_002662, partial [Halobacteriales archaeon]